MLQNVEQQDVVKAAAKRMCEFLGSKGVRVQHTQMLEALATGLGVASWRALKATLDAPKAPKVPQLGVWQSWSVDAVYRDNNQLYGDRMSGRTPLEAAIGVMIERLTDFGLEVDVIAVVAADGGEHRWDASYVGELLLSTNRLALETVLRLVPEQDCSKARDAGLARTWLESVLAEYPDDDFSELTNYENLGGRNGGGGGITTSCALTPTQALKLLCDLAVEAQGGVLAFEAAHEADALAVYQVEAMCGYFEAYIDHADAGLTGFNE